MFKVNLFEICLFVEFVVCMYIYVFYMFYNDNFVVLMNNLYFIVCLRFGRNGFNLSLDEIECNFVTFMC